MISSTFLSSHFLSYIALSKYRAPKLGFLRSHSSSQLEIAKFHSLFYGSFVSDCSGTRRKIRGIGSQFSINSADTLGSSSATSDQDADAVPMPIVLIDQESDSSATIVLLSFGDRLGALIDTMKALKDLGLDVTKGTVNTDASVTQTKFFITKM